MDFGLQNNNTLNLGNLNNGISNNIPTTSIPVVNPVAAPVQEPVMYTQPPVIQPVQEPVATQVTTNVEVTQTPLTTPIQPVVNEVMAQAPVAQPIIEEPVQEEQTEMEKAQSVLRNFELSEAKVPVLKEFLHNILNTVRGRQSVGTAGLVQFKFEHETLTLIASDGSYHIIQKDPTSKYPGVDAWDTSKYPQSFGIEVESLTTLIDKLNTETVIFTREKFDGNNKIVILTADGGSFMFDEKCDLDGSSLQIDLPEQLFNATAQPLLKPMNFKTIMTMCTPLIKDMVLNNPLKGVCFNKGKIMVTDTASMILANLPSEISNLEAFISADVVETISKVKFGTYLEVGICANPIENPSITKCLVLRGSNVYVMAPCKEDALFNAYPTDGIIQLGNMPPNIRLKVDPNELYNKIDTVCIFNGMGIKPRDVVRFDINGNEMLLSSFYSAGKAKVSIKEGTATLQNKLFDKKSLLTIIQKANEGDIELGIQTSTGSIKFRIAYDDIIACLAEVEGM